LKSQEKENKPLAMLPLYPFCGLDRWDDGTCSKYVCQVPVSQAGQEIAKPYIQVYGYINTQLSIAIVQAECQLTTSASEAHSGRMVLD
jgi:hypothetical protein